MKAVKSGFTLVELMVVLAILVLLVALVGPRLLGSQEKADIKAAVQQIDSLETALKLYHVDNRNYPSTEEGLQALLSKPSDENRAKSWDGPYLDEDTVPADPWGNAYTYQYPPAHGSRDIPNIASKGKDGQENTEDDIKNWSDAGSTDGEAKVDPNALTDVR